MPIRDRLPEEYTPGTTSYQRLRRRQDPNYELPDGYQDYGGDLGVQAEQSGLAKFIDKVGPYAIGAAGAGPLAYSAAAGTGLFAGGTAGAAGAGAAAPEMIGPGLATAMTPETIASIGAGGAGAGGGSGMLGGIGKFLGSKGGQFALGSGMSLLGSLFGPEGFQRRESYTGSASPQATLEQALAAISGLGSRLEHRGPPQLRSSMVPAPPAPVQIPGLGFQIGGGLGMDPALLDRSLLTGRDTMGAGSNVFGGTSPTGTQGGSPRGASTESAQLRKPKGF